MQDHPGFLYAVSWEVCNPVGGVHTVLETSARHLAARYGDDLLYVGPDLWAERARLTEFVEDPHPPPLAALAAERDVPVRFGHWCADGPPVALVDFGRLLENKNGILGDLWKEFAVDSIHADWDTIERVLFGYAAGTLVELHYHAAVRPRARRAVAHFHQWTTGAGLLRLARSAPEIGTVYTPHGTALGRALAADGVALDRELERIDPAAAAREHSVEAEHSVECAVARQASVLACVSEQVSEEAAHLLGRRADLITPNGYTPKAAEQADRKEVRAAIVRASERFLGSPLGEARIAFCSGRYEFRNKGFDLALRALGRLQQGERPPRRLLFNLFVTAAQTGARPEAVRRLQTGELAGESCGICTHNLVRPDEDPILLAAREAGLANHPDDAVQVIFVPILLDRRDPIFPHSHRDVLLASDFSVFPALYEPWGYTPLESLAAGVPTITTNLTGFGRFVESVPAEERGGVTVLDATVDEDALVEALAERMRRFLSLSDEELAAQQRAGGPLVARTSWDRLVDHTFEAHRMAGERAGSLSARATGPAFSPLSRRAVVVLPARSENRPHLHDFTVTAALPETLARLGELARNVWWCWNPRAAALFGRLGTGHPVHLLRTAAPERLDEASRDPAWVAEYEAVLAEFDAYLARPAADVPPTAYFCAEFALHESLPVYSGGLGVLAGDHLKSASDLALPLCAVGLRYANGYFVQRIQPDGRQGVEYRRVDPRDTPLVEVTDDEGTPLRITIPMPERELKAGVWRVDAGAVPLFLLDTLVAENQPGDQEVTDRLYPAEREPRLRQEILLGMGGWRMLRALGRTPQVCHLNEGHSAFLLLERLLELIEEEGLTYAEAEAVVRSSTLFTTHTPVPAGHDRFSEGLMRRYFGPVAQRLGLGWEEFLDLGRASRDEHDFSMTVLALRLSGRANGVSKLHGEVSRDMLAGTWPGMHESEVPVESVTNGVHLPTWVGPEMRALFDAGLDADWTGEIDWKRAAALDDDALWTAHVAQKKRMLDWLRDSVEATGLRRGESAAALRRRLDGIDEDALWIGYARRFAPYKRATLLFRDRERLKALLQDETRPIRVVFAGKSHPADGEGAELVRTIVGLTGDADFEGRVFFVEDYGLAAGRMLVQGVDVWLNTPTRPLEASGTSGMKACLNGAPHFSVLDGWWCEAYDGENGWTIGEGREYANPEMQLEHDSRSLYSHLETEIAPRFFERDAEGRPAAWLETVKRTLATVPAFFNTHRMVGDYVRFGYAPLGTEGEELRRDAFAGARARAARYQRLRDAWPQVRIENVEVTDLSRGSLGIGDVFEVRARVHLGALAADDVVAELYAGPTGPRGELEQPVVIPLLREGELENGTAEFRGAYLPRGAGTFRYGVRVRPHTATPNETAHLDLIAWA